MNSFWKKFVSVLLTAMMLLTASPLTALAKTAPNNVNVVTTAHDHDHDHSHGAHLLAFVRAGFFEPVRDVSQHGREQAVSAHFGGYADR